MQSYPVWKDLFQCLVGKVQYQSLQNIQEARWWWRWCSWRFWVRLTCRISCSSASFCFSWSNYDNEEVRGSSDSQFVWTVIQSWLMEQSLLIGVNESSWKQTHTLCLFRLWCFFPVSWFMRSIASLCVCVCLVVTHRRPWWIPNCMSKATMAALIFVYVFHQMQKYQQFREQIIASLHTCDTCPCSHLQTCLKWSMSQELQSQMLAEPSRWRK